MSTDIIKPAQQFENDVMALALVTIALFSRYMRSAMLDNLTEDWVRTARSTGESESS